MSTVLLILLFLILPNIYILVFQTGTQYPRIPIFYAVTLFILIQTLYKSIKNKNYTLTLPVDIFNLFLLSFLSLFLLSTIFSISTYASILGTWVHSQGGLIFTFSLIILFIFFAQKSSVDTIKKFSIITIIGILLTLIWGYVTYRFGPNFKGILIRPSFTEYNPIYLANYVMIGVPLSLGLLLCEKRLLAQSFFALSFIIICCGLVLSLTRGVWIAVSLSLLVFAAIYFFKIRPNIVKLLIHPVFLFLSLLTIVASIFFWPLISGRISSTIEDNPTENSISLRTSEYRSAINIIKDYPLLGTGPDTIYYIFPKYRETALNNNPSEWLWITYNIRNYYLQLVATIGIPALIAFLGMIVTITWQVLSYLKHSKNNSEFLLILGLFTSLIAILIQYLSYGTTFAVQIFFWTILGLLFGKTLLIKPKYLSITFPTVVVKAFFTLTLVAIPLLLIAGYYDFRGRTNYKESNEPRSQYRNLELTQKAIDSNPLVTYYRKQYSSIMTERLLVNLQRNEFFPENKQNLITAQQHLDFVKTIDPHDPLIFYYQANLSFINYRLAKVDGEKDRTQEYNQALSDAQEAFFINPTRADILDLVTQVYLENDGKSLKEAEISARHTLILRPTFTHAWHHLGEALKQQGKFDEAIKAYQEALKLDSNDNLAVSEIEKINKIKK